MSATSPAPWEVTSNGGAMTIVARDRSVVAIVLGSGAASPFESSNAALLSAAPDLLEVARGVVAICDGGPVPEGLYATTVLLGQARAALAKAVGP